MPNFFATNDVQVVEAKDDVQSALVRIRATKERDKGQIIDLLNDAVDVIFGSMKANVPRSAPGTKNPRQSPQTIASSIDREKIPRYSPGGAGGGGFFDARVGFADPPAHLQFVLEGTGIHGPTGSYITAPEGNLQTFFSNRGGWVSTRETEGQVAQRDWYDDAWREGNEVLIAGLPRVMGE